MAMYSIRLDGDTRAMLRRIRSFSEIDKQGINAALAEGARESTLERFKQSKGPDGRRWKTSIRAAQEGGKTLIQSAQLRNSIHAKSDTSGRGRRKPSVFRWAASGSRRSKSASPSRPVPSSVSQRTICRR